jgi:CRP/FNR family transcriptional regulator
MKSAAARTAGTRPPGIHLGCGLLESCYPAGSSLGDTRIRGTLACSRTLVKRGRHLYQSGDPISSIYSVMAGAFKTCNVTEKGEEQVMGFYMRGAILGLEALATGRHTAAAVALEDSLVCVVSAECLQQHCLQDRSVAQRVHAAMAKEIKARQQTILMLGSKTAEERVATFLTELAAAYFALGNPASDMNILMTRAEIGSYLGLTLETVSRILSDLRSRRLLTVNSKRIRILDLAALERLRG